MSEASEYSFHADEDFHTTIDVAIRKPKPKTDCDKCHWKCAGVCNGIHRCRCFAAVVEDALPYPPKEVLALKCIFLRHKEHEMVIEFGKKR